MTSPKSKPGAKTGAPAPLAGGWTGRLTGLLSSRNFLLLSAFSIGGTVAGMGLGYLFHIITARALPLDQVGILGVWLAVATLLASPMAVVMTVLSREMAKREGHPEQLNFLVKKYLRKIGLGAALLTIIGMAIALAIGQPLMALVLVSLPFSYLLAVFNGYMQATERIWQYSVINNGLLLVKVAAVLLFLYLGWGVGGALGAVVASAMVACLGAAAYVWPKLAKEERVDVHLGSAIGLLLLIQVLTTLMGQLDLFAVQHFITDEAAGLYVVAQTTAQILTYLAGAVAMVLYPKIAKLSAKEMGGPGLKLIALGLGILLPVFAGLWLLARPFILLFYGQKFDQSIAPFQILLFGALFLGAAQILVSVLYARHRETWVLGAYALTIVVEGVLLWTLVPSRGLVGAATAISLTGAALLAVLAAFTFWQMKKEGKKTAAA